MNKGKFPDDSFRRSGTQPYEKLYIYYLQGRVRSSSEFFDDRFIGNWEEDGFSFLFFSDPVDEEVSRLVSSQSDLKLIDQFQMEYDQWQGGRFSSVKIGRFLIAPPWKKSNSRQTDPEVEKIILDPGVVFGNGLHPTTRDCIEALELLYSRQKLNTVMDLGCGTGILALAASALGCSFCLAVDLNLLAARTANRNVQLNAMENKILTVRGDALDFVDSPAELIIANIHYDVMEKLIKSDGFFQKKWFILSGLLRSQAREAVFQLNQRGVEILKEWRCDGVWHTLIGKIR